MASTRDYLEYLNQKIDIAPVNSEEEYQAAGLIESLMQGHGLETRLQDFEAPGLGPLPYRVCGILMFVGVFLAGLLGTPAALVGELLVLVCLVLLGLRYLGIADPIGKLGRPINSQNVIGLHRATGPLVAKGSRPIVIVAHYDTPRENLLFASPFDRFQKYLRKFGPQCTCVAALFAFIQTFPFVSAGIRHLIWVLAIVAALPQLLVGIAAIQERFAPCTEGSNDNKSGVAAMLGVMAMVHPGEDAATGFGEQREARDRETAARLAREAEEAARLAAEQAAYEEQLAQEALEAEAAAELDDGLPEDDLAEEVGPEEFEPAEDEAYLGADEEYVPADASEPDEGQAVPMPPEPQTVIRREVQVERVEGVRHGRETLEGLRILPADCEIVYVEPRQRVRTYEELVEPAPYAQDTYDADAYGEHDGYDAPYDEGQDEYWEEQVEDAGPGVVDRVRGFFSNIRQTVSDKLAERRERKEAAAAEASSEYEDEYAYEEAAEPEFLDAIIEDDAEGLEDEPDVPTEDALTEDAPEVLDFEPLAEVAPDGATAEEEALLEEVHAVVDGPSQSGTLTLVPDLGEPVPEAADEPVAEAVAPKVEENADGTLQFVPLGELIDGSEVDDQPKDVTGLDTLAEDSAVNESRGADVRPEPAPVDDPEWGKSSFRPQVSSVARRAVLFDLPDPLGSTGSGDPLAGSDATTVVDRGQLEVAAEEHEANAAPSPEAAAQAPKKGGLRGLFGRRRQEEQQESIGSWLGVGDDFDAKQTGSAIGSWDNFESTDATSTDDGSWKGGAARRSDLRVVKDDDVRVQEDLREAILGMGDDELVAHDIWFVALGGSHADHAGMRAFLADNRRSVRGCFLINLDCVGDGQLTLLTEEGLSGTRRADRRIVRLLTKVAEDLHIGLDRAPHDWEETDATPAMRTSLRCATICGLTPDDALALSKVADDEPDLVDPSQTTDVADLVAELIRRS